MGAVGERLEQVPEVRRMQRFLAPALLALASVPVAVGIAKLLYSNPLPMSLAILGAVAVGIALVFVLARYEASIYVGFLLTSIVLVQPAPSDLLFGLIMAVAFVTGRFRLVAVPRSAIFVVAWLIVMNLLSMTNVISWSVAGSFFFITLYLALFGLWCAGYVDSYDRAGRLVRAYLFTACVSAALASAALFIPFPGHALLIGDQERAKGLFKDPNVYGPFLIPIALIVAEEIFHPRLLRMRKSARIACFLLLMIGVLFSYSRAAWLNLAVGLIVLLALVVVRRPDRRALSLMMTAVLGAVAIVAAIFLTGSLSFLQERAKYQSYDTERFASQARGIKYGLEHLFGVGPGQYELLSPLATHSLYVRVLAEQGVFGLLAIISLVLVTSLFGVLNFARGNDTFGISAAALLAAWCGLCANSFFVDTLHWRHLWLVAALVWAGILRGQSRDPLHRYFAGRPRRPSGGLPRRARALQRRRRSPG